MMITRDLRTVGVADHIARHWRGILVYGLIFTVLGILAIVVPAAATLATELLVAWLLIFSGAAGLIFSWNIRAAFDWWYTALLFLLTLVLGLIFLFFPAAGIATLTLLLVALFLVEGVVSLLLAFRVRSHIANWGWLLFSGVASLLIALIILSGWPGSAAWAIGLLVGINLLSTGIALIMLSLAGRGGAAA